MSDLGAADWNRFLPDGGTRVFGIIGDPIVQVRSPTTMTGAFRRHGLNAALLPLQISSADLDTTLDALKRIGNLDGLIVTLPHKVAALRHADIVATETRLLGAINALRRSADGRWHGDNFDGRGFVAGLRAHGHEPYGRKALVIGCGGAGAAIAFALAHAGVMQLHLHDLDGDRARGLAERLAQIGSSTRVNVTPPHSAAVELLVNATPCGMDGDMSVPLDPESLTPQMLVAEAVNKPSITPLLHAAQERGCRIHSGVHMSEGQSQLLVEFFLSRVNG